MSMGTVFTIENVSVMEQHLLDSKAGKQLSEAATDVLLTLVLKKWTTFKYRLELWPPVVDGIKLFLSANYGYL